MICRKALRGHLVCVAMLASLSVAVADKYPAQPIRLTGLYASGSSVEVVTRYIGQVLSEEGWPPLVYESRPGGYGSIGALSVKQSPPDGYNLLQADVTSHAVSASMVPSLQYDPVKDFTPITLLWEFPSVLVLKSDHPANSLSELIAAAKNKPGGISYASQGSGSGGHILGAMLEKAAGVKMVHVPYRGPTPAVNDLVAGQTDFLLTGYGSVKELVASGKLKAIAMTSPERLADIPNVPTMTELGYPSVTFNIWFGLMGPANLPEPIAKAVREKIHAVLNRPDVLARIKDQGWIARPSTPDEFRKLIETDIVRVRGILTEAGVAVAK